MVLITKRHYDRAVVKCKQKFNVLGELKEEKYYIVYDVTILGIFKSKRKFYTKVCGMDGYYNITVYKSSVKEIIDEYNKFISNKVENTIVKTIKSTIQKVYLWEKK